MVATFDSGQTMIVMAWDEPAADPAGGRVHAAYIRTRDLPCGGPPA
jgi:hypothetical protein